MSHFFIVLDLLLWSSRLLRLCVALIQLYGYCYYKPRPRRLDDKVYTSKDATIITNTLELDPDFPRAVEMFAQSGPGEFIVVTVPHMVDTLRNALSHIKGVNINVCSVKKPGMRDQTVEGIRQAKSKIIVFADDDVLWQSNTLDAVLAGFSDPQVGGICVSQEVRPYSRGYTTWERFGVARLERRNVMNVALAYFQNGLVLNLSGRTVAYRAHLLKGPEFAQALTQDYWLGKYLMKTGDDNFLTAWISKHGWRTAYQNRSDAKITTTVKADREYLKQLSRWTRDSLRHNIRILDGAKNHTYSSITMLQAVLIGVSNFLCDIQVLFDTCITVALIIMAYSEPLSVVTSPKKLIVQHILYTFILQCLEHFPLFNRASKIIEQLTFLPMLWIYQYLHSGVFVYSVATLNKSVWGTRPDPH